MDDAENHKELKREETLKAIGELCLLDDNLMTLVFDRNIEATDDAQQQFRNLNISIKHERH